tara:strand:+ start:333 stop:641 length:309 start_codon:yes stop_codon:yes gene_type:complete
MNKTLRFGYQSFGNHKLIKINAKIGSIDANNIADSFPDLNIINNGKHGYRIEGCLYFNKIFDFDDALKLACIDYKISMLMHQAQTIIGKNDVVIRGMDALDI